MGVFPCRKFPAPADTVFLRAGAADRRYVFWKSQPAFDRRISRFCGILYHQLFPDVGSKAISFLSPYSYFSAAEISHTGFYAWDYLVCCVLLAAIFLIAAYRLFLKKDVQFRS